MDKFELLDRLRWVISFFIIIWAIAYFFALMKNNTEDNNYYEDFWSYQRIGLDDG